jgi:hypothetical protein
MTMAQRNKRKKNVKLKNTVGMEDLLNLIAALPADMFPKKRIDPKPQRRPGLLQMFRPKQKSRSLKASKKA